MTSRRGKAIIQVPDDSSLGGNMAAPMAHSDSDDRGAGRKDRVGSWSKYAAAAGATIAAASSADANIIYSVARPPIEAKFAHQPSLRYIPYSNGNDPVYDSRKAARLISARMELVRL